MTALTQTDAGSKATWMQRYFLVVLHAHMSAKTACPATFPSVFLQWSEVLTRGYNTRKMSKASCVGFGLFMRARSEYAPDDSLDLEERIEREPSDLHGRPRGLVVPEELGVDRVHGLEVVHGVEEDLCMCTYIRACQCVSVQPTHPKCTGPRRDGPRATAEIGEEV